ncbi:hypothetical protein ACFQL7_03830 [Halocatena marina]|uniref:Pectate lyase superfamily protein domain-containing protein n=1 Tax=Halocatena marina TaxID=2934937 RepID=A0ABD5YM41_9EURY
MKLTGAVVTGSAVGTTQIGRARAATHHGITFDRVVDAVADLGCDPKGNADVSSKVESALDGQTLVEFPSGTYHWDGSVTLDTDRIGIRGTSDDVLFTFPAGYNQFFINGSCEQALYENFDVDIQPENTATGIRVASERGFHIENIEHIGRGTADSSDVTRCWQLRVNDPDATGVVKNFVAKKGSAWAHYKGGDGRVGISIYGGEGTIKVIDCHLEEFGNNGIYASRSLSSVQVEGGTYRNNNVAGIRFSGKGSYVDGATIEVDPSKYSGPRTREDDSFKMRGIVVEQGNSDTGGFDDAGAQIRNTDITIQDNPTTGQAISMWTGGRTLAVSNTRIVYNNDGAPAIYREEKPHKAATARVRAHGGSAWTPSRSPALRQRDQPSSPKKPIIHRSKTATSNKPETNGKASSCLILRTLSFKIVLSRSTRRLSPSILHQGSRKTSDIRGNHSQKASAHHRPRRTARKRPPTK